MHKLTLLKKPCSLTFTLIEMLVVIAIIGILASMLAPSLTNALRTGRSIVCQNNLKKIGIASMIYADENNGILIHNGGAWSSGLRSYAHLSNYLWFTKIDQWQAVSYGTIFHCPEAQTALTIDTSNSWAYDAYTCNYGLNRNLGGGIPTSKAGTEYVPRIKLLQGSRLWFGDGGGTFKANGNFAFSSALIPMPIAYDATGRYTPLPFYHPETELHPGLSANLLYGDCSSMPMRYDEYVLMDTNELKKLGGDDL